MTEIKVHKISFAKNLAKVQHTQLKLKAIRKFSVTEVFISLKAASFEKYKNKKMERTRKNQMLYDKY